MMPSIVSRRFPVPAARLLLCMMAAALGIAVVAAQASNAARPPAPRPAASGAAVSPSISDATRAAVAKRIPGVKPDDVKVSLVPGILEVSRGAEIFYVTADARYVFAGDLYDLEGEQNLSERRRRETRSSLLATVPESQMIIFGPRDAKYTVTVFTDIDCGFCRKLHSEIAKYNDAGIRVRYLFYPRTGPNTESWQKAVSVWCAKDRNDALTRAKRGEALPEARCGKTPVDRDYEIGQDLVVTGTPAIVLANGEMVAGYRNAPALLKLAQAAARP